MHTDTCASACGVLCVVCVLCVCVCVCVCVCCCCCCCCCIVLCIVVRCCTSRLLLLYRDLLSTYLFATGPGRSTDTSSRTTVADMTAAEPYRATQFADALQAARRAC